MYDADTQDEIIDYWIEQEIEASKPKIRYYADRLHFKYHSDNDKFAALVDKIHDDIVAYYDGARFNGTKAHIVKAKKDHIAGIILHGLMSYIRGKWTHYPRDHHQYKANKIKGKRIKPRYCKSRSHAGIEGMSCQHTKDIIDYLAVKGLVLHQTGRKRDKVESSYTPTPALLKMIKKTKMVHPYLIKELIQLRASRQANIKKPFIDYLDTKETNQLRDAVNWINQQTSNYDIGFRWPVDDQDQGWATFKTFYKRYYGADWQDHYLKKTRYHRSFSDNFEHGGRWYGVWWQDHCPTKLRQYITIDGQKTIERDYKALHPSMACGLAGVPIPDDPYQIEGYDITDRKIMKAMMLRIFNASSQEAALNSLRLEFRQHKDVNTGIWMPASLAYTANIPDCKNSSLLPLVNALKKKHAAIQDYFFSGIGLKMQFWDSVIAHKVMVDMFNQNICALCIHDSFIIQTKYKDILDQSMQTHFYNKFKIKIQID